MPEVYVRTVEDTPLYRVDEVKIWSSGRYKPMLELMLKVNGGLVFVRRYDRVDAELILPKHIKQVEDAFERGYFCLRGKGDPLKEFSDPLEDLTKIEDTEVEGVKRFSGNHKRYSAAFDYLIWDKELIEEIEKRLNKGGDLEG